jgi:biotin carboxylase
MRPRLLLVGAGHQPVEAAQAAGFEVWLLLKKDTLKLPALARADYTLVLDYENIEETLEVIKPLHLDTPFAAVYSFTEYGLWPAAALAAALDTRGFPIQAVQCTRDKAMMRARLDVTCLSPVRYRLCHNPGEIAEFALEAGWPVILKSVTGAGKRGVHLVESREQCAPVMSMLQAETGEPAFLAEEFVAGPEVSVEFFSANGRHLPITITAKKSDGPRCNEIGHTVPVAMDPDQRQDAYQLTACFLDAIGYDFGLSHTEMRLARDGWRIIESHTRPPGDRIADLIGLVFGIDVYGLLFEFLATGVTPVIPAPAGGAAIRFFIPEPGLVTRIGGLDEARSLPGVVEVALQVAAGDQVAEARGNDSRSGYVITRADSPGAAAEIAEKVIGMVTVETVDTVVTVEETVEQEVLT